MKFSENQVLENLKGESFKVVKISSARRVLIQFCESKQSYFVDATNINNKTVCDHKFDLFKLFSKEYPQKDGSVVIILDIDGVKKGRTYYKCVFKDTLNIISAPQYLIINGELKDTTIKAKTFNEEEKELYSKWCCIKYRCYDKRSKSYKDYGAKGIKICDAWLDFDTFKNWYLENKYENNLSIDKDILCNINHIKNKIYSPETCLLIPSDLNCWLASDCLETGVTKIKSEKYKAKINGKYLGVFETFKEAKEVYAKEKYKKWKELINQYNLPNYIKEILLKYDFSWNWLIN